MNNETVLLLWQFISAVVIPHVIEALKGQKWFPFANFNTASLNRVFSWTVAALTGLGLTFSFEPSVGRLVVTGLTTAGIIAGLTHMFSQVAANHVLYKVLVAPPISGLQQAINRETGTTATASVPVTTAPVDIAPPIPPAYVGATVPGATDLFVSLTGDPTPIGTDVTVGGKAYTRISKVYYEAKSKTV